MFKRLGIFAILAVCLFAIVIVMVGCNGNGGEGGNGNGKGTEIIKPKVETPAEKLAGTYSLVEVRHPDGRILRPPSITGEMFLRNSDTISNALYLTSADGDTADMEFTWSADETYFLDEVGDRISYTWDGTHLTLPIPLPGGGLPAVTSWRKE